MREAVERGETARVLIRNYRQDGSLFWNEVVIQPVRNPAGQLTHFVAYYRDASERLKGGEKAAQGLPSWLREDRLTGLHSRAYFEELLQRDWLLAQRDSHEIALTLFDIDDLSTYNDTFDKSAGDACIRRVARVIGASYRRGGDLVGRWEGGTLAALTQGDAAQKAPQYAQVVAQRVRDLLIHHPRNGSGRYLTISAGVASLVPEREMPLEALLKACRAALKRAKVKGKNNIITAGSTDFS
jgi:diguanylate cyclase (GGDEF)-like protein